MKYKSFISSYIIPLPFILEESFIPLFSEIQSYVVCSLYARQCWIHPIRVFFLEGSEDVLVLTNYNFYITQSSLPPILWAMLDSSYDGLALEGKNHCFHVDK